MAQGQGSLRTHIIEGFMKWPIKARFFTFKTRVFSHHITVPSAMFPLGGTHGAEWAHLVDLENVYGPSFHTPLDFLEKSFHHAIQHFSI